MTDDKCISRNNRIDGDVVRFHISPTELKGTHIKDHCYVSVILKVGSELVISND